MTKLAEAVDPTDTNWTGAVKLRREALDWLNNEKITLAKNPSEHIGGLNEKLSEVRDRLNKVRDIVFDSQGLLIVLRREAHKASDAYERSLETAILNSRSLSPDAQKSLPKSADERELYYRKDFLELYKLKLEAERRVEEWESFQKMVNTVYYDLKDASKDIITQIQVIKQQYFSGEIKLSKEATALFDFLGEDAQKFIRSTESTDLSGLEFTPESASTMDASFGT